jgi:hypothetical protein
MKQYIVQFGSGKPGEMGTESTELEVFNRLGIQNPNIGFAPFHQLVHDQSNDWTIFRDIAKKKTSIEPQLFELDKGEDIHRLQEQLHHLNIMVLGAGFVEHYVKILNQSGTSGKLHEFFQRGGVLMGYSAGSVTLSSMNVNALSWDRIFSRFQNMIKNKPEQKGQIWDTIMGYCRDDNREHVKSLLTDIEKGSNEWHHQSICSEVAKVFMSPALNFVPDTAMYPHYGEHCMGMPYHLQAASLESPEFLHIGLPNGVCLLHEYEDGKFLASELIGAHPHQKPAVNWQRGREVQLQHGRFNLKETMAA